MSKVFAGVTISATTTDAELNRITNVAAKAQAKKYRDDEMAALQVSVEPIKAGTTFEGVEIPWDTLKNVNGMGQGNAIPCDLDTFNALFTQNGGVEDTAANGKPFKRVLLSGTLASPVVYQERTVGGEVIKWNAGKCLIPDLAGYPLAVTMRELDFDGNLCGKPAPSVSDPISAYLFTDAYADKHKVRLQFVA